jgi:4-amino-4-deoxy-L-arabinose transferase-like glycosyltransferase
MLGFLKTGTRKEITISILWIISVCFLTFLVNLYWSPHYVGLKSDSSIFAYGGNMVSEDKLLYRDLWNDKPPAIFYMDAMAIRLMGTSLWTFWWWDIFWVTLSCSTLFLILRKLTGTFSAMLASGVFLITLMYPTIFEGGNLTEMYGTLPLILIIGVGFLFFQSKRKSFAFVLGFLTAVAFLFKQTCVALGIGFALATLILNIKSRQYKTGLIHLAWMAAGVILPLGGIAMIWVHAHAFADLLDGLFVNNINYINTGITLNAVFATFRIFMFKLPLFPLSLTTLGSLGIFIAHNNVWLFSRGQGSQEVRLHNPISAKQLTFLAIFLALPFEVGFIALSGRNFMHYYMTILPAFSAANAYLIENLLRPIFSRQRMSVIEIVSLIALILLNLFSIVNAYQKEKPKVGLRNSLAGPFFGTLPQSNIEKYILSHTGVDDSILIWGDNKSLNILTGRRSPSRYYWPSTLFQPKTGSVSRFDQFLEDLQKDPPSLILVPKTSNPSEPFINLPDDQLCPGCIPQAVEGMKLFKLYINANYQLIPQVDNYAVYVRMH